jgi:elongation factor P--beta-lysine ligase
LGSARDLNRRTGVAPVSILLRIRDRLEALSYGSIGIDRLCMMLLGQESIRDVILFSP